MLAGRRISLAVRRQLTESSSGSGSDVRLTLSISNQTSNGTSPQLSYFGSSNDTSSTEIRRSISKPTFKLLYYLGFGSTFVRTAILPFGYSWTTSINPNSVNNNSCKYDILLTN